MPTIQPITFTGPMVSALLDGRKTQTRRVLGPQPGHGAIHYRSGTGKHIWDWPGLGIGSDDGRELPQVPYLKGDLLYVRERVVRVKPTGKKAAGHLLDGVEHFNWPDDPEGVPS